MKSRTFDRKIMDKYVVKGTVSADGTSISIVEDDELKNVLVSDFMDYFKGDEITFSIARNSSVDLLNVEEEEEPIVIVEDPVVIGEE